MLLETGEVLAEMLTIADLALYWPICYASNGYRQLSPSQPTENMYISYYCTHVYDFSLA